MAGRDWRKPRVDAVRADRAVEVRLDSADPSGILGTSDQRVLCEGCFDWMAKGTPMRRVNRAESPSGEGGYVHTDADLCARLREEEQG